jgi:hypothetical protein
MILTLIAEKNRCLALHGIFALDGAFASSGAPDQN